MQELIRVLDALRRLFFFAVLGVGVVLVIYGNGWQTLSLGAFLIIIGLLLGLFPLRK